MEVVEQQPFISPHSLLLKTSSGGEVNPGRLVLHAPLPCRPQPIKGSPVSLPWSSPPVTSLMMGPFPSLAPVQGLRPGSVSVWHKQGAPKPSPLEPSVLFRLRNLPEHTEAPRKTLEKKEKAACWTEKVGAEAPREACEGPLDLSEPKKSTSSQSPMDYSPTADPAEDSPGGHLKTEPSPRGDASPTSSPSSPEEQPAAGSKAQVRSGSNGNMCVGEGGPPKLMWQQVSKEQKKEVNGSKEQSDDKKVPVLTISLRPGKGRRNIPSSPCVCRETTKTWNGLTDWSGISPGLLVMGLL